MNKSNKIVCFFLASLFVYGSFFVYNNFILASSGEVSHIVISEIKIGGESANDEFIEIYNPTNSEINLNGWDLKRKTKSGSEYNILNNAEGAIPAHGYFLITPRANCGENKSEACYKGTVSADDEYTTDSFLANDNTILIYDNSENLTSENWVRQYRNITNYKRITRNLLSGVNYISKVSAGKDDLGNTVFLENSYRLSEIFSRNGQIMASSRDIVGTNYKSYISTCEKIIDSFTWK